MIQWMLAIWSLVPLPFLKPVWTSGISQFTYCWSLAWRILSITLLAWDECNCAVVWASEKQKLRGTKSWGKNPHLYWHFYLQEWSRPGERKRNHIQLVQSILFFTQSVLKEKLLKQSLRFYQSLSDLGEGKCTTPATLFHLMQRRDRKGKYTETYVMCQFKLFFFNLKL